MKTSKLNAINEHSEEPTKCAICRRNCGHVSYRGRMVCEDCINLIKLLY